MGSAENKTTADQRTALEHLAYARVYLDQGDLDNAIEELTLAATVDPDNVDVQTALGKAHLQKKHYDKAVEHLELAMNGAPHFADLHYLLGCAYMEAGNRERAINEFKEALNINPRYTAARNNLGRIMKTLSRTPAQEDSRPDDAEARQANTHFHLGNALMQKNLLQEALVEYREAVRLRPNYPDIRAKIGELYMRRGLYNLAEEEFLHSLKINPRYIGAQINLAETYRLHSEQLLEKAESQYQKLLDADPENELAHDGLRKVRNLKKVVYDS